VGVVIIEVISEKGVPPSSIVTNETMYDA